ncbi:MAG: alpha/beta hydrolase [Proteobacteria bacterium]|nr:alpha/beta hydrolase [Pseudomonadota bacterium]
MPFRGDPIAARAWMVGPLGTSWDDGSAAIRKTLKRSRTARRITPGRRMKLPYEELTITTHDGVDLAAWFVPAAEDAPDRGDLMAVLHHHYGGQKATVLPWIELFHRLGVPTLSFDARGHAASGPSPEGRGSFVKRAADAEAACDEVRRRGAGRILAFGQSQGAAALLMSVAWRADLAGVITDCGPAPEMGTAAWGLSGNMLGAVGSRNRLTRAVLAMRIIPGTEPVRYLGALWSSLAALRSTPLLWISAGRDEVIRPAWSRVWYRSLRSRSDAWSSLHVPDADHVRTLQVDREGVEGAVGDFIDRLTGRT